MSDSTKPLQRHARFASAGPVVLVVMDGIGIGARDAADAVAAARTPTLDGMWRADAGMALLAHGPAVGLPSEDDMGNSEVGHNALGAGKIHDQGAKLIERALADGSLWRGEAWQAVVAQAKAGHTLHFLGLLSDGNVHSHIAHLEAMLREAARQGCRRLMVHALLDGRDVAPTSALTYVERLEVLLAELRAGGVTAHIASGGGRMVVTMDRYEADWAMVERGFQTHVHGEGPRFASAQAAILAARAATPAIIDQDLPPFVIADAQGPIGRIVDGDAVVMFNFRGDRAIEISRAFTEATFTPFARGAVPKVLYVGMMEYDGDLHIPARYLVSPPAIVRPMGELLAEANVSQLAISETQKYGHVTFFWNGNRSGKFDERSETYIEIPSERLPFEERPWMKAAEITDRLIAELRTGRHQFARVNYPNGDMVGHTGHFEATVLAVQAVDLQLARVRRAVDDLGGTLVVTADHGNADEMYQRDKKGGIQHDKATGRPIAKTSHTLNKVPFLIHGPGRRYGLAALERAGIANITSTCLELLGFAPPSDWEPSLLCAKTPIQTL